MLVALLFGASGPIGCVRLPHFFVDRFSRGRRTGEFRVERWGLAGLESAAIP
ncbi:MAG: hypothetical protein RI897_4269 [Verrucomicrobiota bacterium]|jgi:hypothetical protein